MALLVTLDPADRALIRELIGAITASTSGAQANRENTVASLDNLTAAIAKLDTDVSQAAGDVTTASHRATEGLGGQP